MILEGIVTTLSEAGEVNIAPMGPEVAGTNFDRFVLKPFNTSTTYQNLKRQGEGVLHVTDDVLLLAQAAVGRIDPAPRWIDAKIVKGRVLAEACRHFEFRVTRLDDSAERVRIEAEVLHRETVRDFFGFNRAMFAVLEAAILATRVHMLPKDQLKQEYARLRVLVDKTGGPREAEAFAFLEAFLESVP